MNAHDRTSPPDPLIRPLIDALHQAGRPRVWSIVITIFGDAAAHRDWRIAMSELQTLLDPLGVGGGALRTAMSRLAAEGWVEREKAGRNAFYLLAKPRRAEVTAAGERIYAANPVDGGDWVIAIEPTPPEEPGEAARLARNVRIAPAAEREAAAAAGRLVIEGRAASAPAWAQESLLPPENAAAFAALANLLGGLLADAGACRALPPRDAMIARVLVVHFWRRLLLRHPFLPAEFVPQDWPGFAAHQMVRQAYGELIAGSEAWWPEKTPRRAIERIRRRFGVDD